MTDINHPLPACPRCDGVWDYKSSEFCLVCPRCDINYYPANPAAIYWNTFIQDESRLAWYFQIRECFYGTLLELAGLRGTKLPWLDFKISFEKLKLYLLFS